MTAPTTTRAPSLGQVLGLLVDAWTLLVVQQALLGATRFGEFRERLPISNAVLAERLSTLVDAGVLERDGHDYVLTARGRALWPVFLAIWDWERRWDARGSGHLPVPVHATCGAELVTVPRCTGCGSTATFTDVSAAWGPAGGWATSIPTSPYRRSRLDPSLAPWFTPRTLAVVGDRWSLAILIGSFFGMRAFGDFTDALGVPPAILTQRLRALVDAGLLASARSGRRSDWVEYAPSDAGRGLWVFFVLSLAWAMAQWPATSSELALRHRHCGELLHLTLQCGQCDTTISGRDVRPGTTPT